MAVNGNGTTDPAVGNHTYAPDAVVNISATAAEGWQFVNWSGDVGTVPIISHYCDYGWEQDGYGQLHGSDHTNTDASPVITYTLTMAVNGSGTTDPVVGNHTYAPDAVVNISATAAEGWQFVNWSGDVVLLPIHPTTVTMDANKMVTANFTEISVPTPTPTPAGMTYTLTMAVNGSGSTNPEVGNHTYAPDAVVNISATAAEGWQFVNWTRRCRTGIHFIPPL